jgi:uncharacterized protein (DUF849 family)
MVRSGETNLGDLVAEAVRMVREMGKSVATVEETRKKLGL